MEGHLGSLLVLTRILQIGILNGSLHILANHQRTCASMLVPPLDEGLVIGSLMTYLPINLGHAVVEPAIVHPQQDVGIEIVVILGAVGVTTNLGTTLVAIDAEGRDTHLDPRLDAMNGLIELLHEEVHIITTPVVDILDTIGVATELKRIGNSHTLHRIGIEIIVHVDAIDIVARDDILGHLADVVASLRNAWIQNQQSVVLETEMRCTIDDMACSQRLGGLGASTIGIDPRMQFHTTLVALSNHPLQGIPIRRWRLALNTCEESAPGLDLALVERITLWAHLEDNQIDTILLQLVELIGQRLLHLLCTHTLELSVHTLNPCPTHFALLAHCWQSQQHCHNQHYSLLYHHHFNFQSSILMFHIELAHVRHSLSKLSSVLT